jgi:sugar fermentation stimulation protein A
LAEVRFWAHARGRILRGTFLRRLNRFVVEAESGGETVQAHLPNPGRLWEILFPGTELALLPTPNSPKLACKAVAARRNGRWVNLDTIRTNALARFLLEREAVPGLEGWRILSSEVPVGRSRFDFLLERGGERLFLEVKSCTLFQGAMSMFPDAVTERGRRHLLELAALGETGSRGAVLVVSQGPESRFFLPDYHTDPAFARAFMDVRGKVGLFAVSIGWEEDLSLAPGVRPLEIPWGVLEKTDFDAGAWLAILDRRAEPGLPPFSVLAGVEASGLDRKMRRIAAKPAPSVVKVLPVRGYTGGLALLEEALAGSAMTVEAESFPGEGKIFGYACHPLANPSFVKSLLDFRMILQPLGKML